MRLLLPPLCLLAVLGLSQCSVRPPVATGDTIHYGALTDFTVLDSAGFVPAYRHGDKDALAINAAKYKDRYAIAVVTFTGPAGKYAAELVTLGETDGESTYVLAVNGRRRGTAKNAPTADDYAPQFHALGNLRLEPGDRITLAFNSQSNGKIPEAGGFAYARGRWREVRLHRLR